VSRKTLFHHALRQSIGASRDNPRRADAGSMTRSNQVKAKLSGLEPLRLGSQMDVTPRHISFSVQMGTMKEHAPRFSPSTMKRATTMAILEMPNSGVVAGINLYLCQKQL
jgi:hypothetical protein